MPPDLLPRAQALLPRVVELRRRLHAHPELGCDLPRTRAAVLEALEGLPLRLWHSGVGSGVLATLEGAHPGPTLLLRGDMDALPISEETGLPFASEVPGCMHACGHDAHTAMLVGAAHLLCELREQLHGTVKFLFQPGEEGHFGARQLVEEGVLELEPAVDFAFAIHVASSVTEVGLVQVRPGPMLASPAAWRCWAWAPPAAGAPFPRTTPACRSRRPAWRSAWPCTRPWRSAPSTARSGASRRRRHPVGTRGLESAFAFHLRQACASAGTRGWGPARSAPQARRRVGGPGWRSHLGGGAASAPPANNQSGGSMTLAAFGSCGPHPLGAARAEGSEGWRSR